MASLTDRMRREVVENVSAELGQKLPIKGACGANKPRRREKEN